MSFDVLSPGLFSLIVGAARPSTRSLGVPVGGPADRLAFAAGNTFLGNPPDAAAVEITLTGPTLKARCGVTLIIFGAPGRLRVDDHDTDATGLIQVSAGQTLVVGPRERGCRAYLCVPGGFVAPEVLGSRGQFAPLRTGDVLTFTTANPPPMTPLRTGWELPRERYGAVRLRVVEGPQADWFAGGLGPFCEGEYAVTPQSDRMGSRLAGPPLQRVRPGEMLSEPVAPGAVQVTNDGRCVVLGVDGQTIGGYPKVAHVCSADLDDLGQLRPGTRVCFEPISVADAVRAARHRAAALQRLADRR